MNLPMEYNGGGHKLAKWSKKIVPFEEVEYLIKDLDKKHVKNI